MLAGLLLLPLTGCQEEKVKFVPNSGQIQVLNGCGKPGAAEEMRNFLTERGFDVVEFGNASSWNYRKTIIASRTGTSQVAQDLAKALKLSTVLHLADPAAMVDATVFIGKDYQELLKEWRKRAN